MPDSKELLSFGIVVIDKPSGPTSHKTAEYVKKILHLKKAGHSGSLDPMVTGILIVGLGKATRLMSYFLTSPKEYIAIMHLHKDIPTTEIKETFNQLIGKIKQIPPVRSAVKRQLREREIYELEILEIKERDVLFRIKCQAGTYIRKICSDIGEMLGTTAHMIDLRRTMVGGISEQKAVKLQDLSDAYHYYKQGDDTQLKQIIKEPGLILKDFLQTVFVKETSLEKISHGHDIEQEDIINTSTQIKQDQDTCVMTKDNKLIATGISTTNSTIKINRVFL